MSDLPSSTKAYSKLVKTKFNPIIKADELLFKWYEYMKYISALIFLKLYLDHQGKFRRCDGSGQVESCNNK